MSALSALVIENAPYAAARVAPAHRRPNSSSPSSESACRASMGEKPKPRSHASAGSAPDAPDAATAVGQLPNSSSSFPLRSTMMRSALLRPTPGARVMAVASPAMIAEASSSTVHHRQDRQRCLGADSADSQQRLEQCPSSLVREPVQLQIVLPDSEVRHEPNDRAGGGQRGEIVGRDRYGERYTSHADHRAVARLRLEDALDCGDQAHSGRTRAEARHCCRSHRATARASDASSDIGSAPSPRSVRTARCTWALSPAP